MSAHRDHVHRYYAGVRHRLLPLITDTVSYVNDAHDAGAKILIEGANATMLDIDFGTCVAAVSPPHRVRVHALSHRARALGRAPLRAAFPVPHAPDAPPARLSSAPHRFGRTRLSATRS